MNKCLTPCALWFGVLLGLGFFFTLDVGLAAAPSSPAGVGQHRQERTRVGTGAAAAAARAGPAAPVSLLCSCERSGTQGRRFLGALHAAPRRVVLR